MLMKLFTIIEYGNSIRGPTFIADQRKVKKYNVEPLVAY